MCQNENCKKRFSCKRFTAIKSTFQWYGVYNADNCNSYIPTKLVKNLKK